MSQNSSGGKLGIGIPWTLPMIEVCCYRRLVVPFVFVMLNLSFLTANITLSAGFYICWGCLVWVPSIYTSPGMYLVNHPVNLGIQVTPHREIEVFQIQCKPIIYLFLNIFLTSAPAIGLYSSGGYFVHLYQLRLRQAETGISQN